MKCPACGGGELIPDTRGLPYNYKGKATVLPQVTGDYCPMCGEVVLTREQGDRASRLMGEFMRQFKEQAPRLE